MEVETIAREVVDCAFAIHRDLGPGFLESVYEAVLAKTLEARGLHVIRQKAISFSYNGLLFDEGFKVDLLIEDTFVVELKSVERIAAVHGKQLLTYLRLMELPLGLLINFGAATFKEGVQRVVNNDTNFSASRLRLHE